MSYYTVNEHIAKATYSHITQFPPAIDIGLTTVHYIEDDMGRPCYRTHISLQCLHSTYEITIPHPPLSFGKQDVWTITPYFLKRSDDQTLHCYFLKFEIIIHFKRKQRKDT